MLYDILTTALVYMICLLCLAQFQGGDHYLQQHCELLLQAFESLSIPRKSQHEEAALRAHVLGMLAWLLQ